MGGGGGGGCSCTRSLSCTEGKMCSSSCGLLCCRAGSAGATFSMADVEGVARGVSGSKLLLNTLLKLQLAAAAGQGEAGMLYRACP